MCGYTKCNLFMVCVSVYMHVEIYSLSPSTNNGYSRANFHYIRGGDSFLVQIIAT